MSLSFLSCSLKSCKFLHKSWFQLKDLYFSPTYSILVGNFHWKIFIAWNFEGTWHEAKFFLEIEFLPKCPIHKPELCTSKHCQNRNYHYIQCNQNVILLVRTTHISPRKSTLWLPRKIGENTDVWLDDKVWNMYCQKVYGFLPLQTLDIMMVTFCWQKWCIVSCPGHPVRHNPIPNVQCRFGLYI